MNKTSTTFIKGGTRIYATDGSGRDTYIGFDNGGNTFKFENSPGCYTKRAAPAIFKGYTQGGGGGSLAH
jgi:hypothetical protein